MALIDDINETVCVVSDVPLSKNMLRSIAITIIDMLKVNPLPMTSDGMPTAETADLRRWNERLEKIIQGEI